LIAAIEGRAGIAKILDHLGLLPAGHYLVLALGSDDGGRVTRRLLRLLLPAPHPCALWCAVAAVTRAPVPP
jgi:hypothetical protein